jgi:hypothetical protein
MRKIVLVLVGGLMFSSFNSIKAASLIDAWDFFNLPNGTNGTPATITATVGAGSLDLSAFGLGSPQGTNPERTSFGGSQLNTFSGSVDTTGTGTALAIANSSANGKSLIFSFSMSGYQSLIVSFAGRGTATGFNTGTWSWSTDGINYITLTGVNTATTSTTFAVKTADFSTEIELNNAATAFLEYSLSGCSSSAGNNRLDNIQFNATSVPEPSTLALSLVGGFAGLVALRRKR